MIIIRPSEERGIEDKEWVKSYYTFSFDHYFSSEWKGFHDLRVLNENILKEGKQFPPHFHKNMEILIYVIEGVLEHKDSLGQISVIRPGEVHRLSAGHGVTHSASNLSHHNIVHFIEVWINPKIHNIPPTEQQKIFSSASKWSQWCLIASGNGRNGSLAIHQDVDIYLTLLEEQEEIAFDAFLDRYYWLQVISGVFSLDGHTLKAGDGVSISDEVSFNLKCSQRGELMLLDLVEI